MGKGWLKEINSELSVSTFLSGDGDWEIFFKGKQGVRELKFNTVVRMWAGDVDSNGEKAKEVHDRAVALLQAKTPLQRTYAAIQVMVSRISGTIYD